MRGRDSEEASVARSFRSASAALRASTPFSLSREIVENCLDENAPPDALFARAWRSGLGVLSRSERAVTAPVIGHVAESVIEVLLANEGWMVVSQQVGPGGHGVDLVLLSPDDRTVAFEIKGTLVPGRIPHLTRREHLQMSPDWLDKSDNPGMSAWGLAGDDVYSGIVAVNFADLTWRVALGADVMALRPARTLEDLRGPAGLLPMTTESDVSGGPHDEP